MNDDTRLRSAINLDELERQLREAASSRGAPQRAAASVDDPLAELARLVGRSEPQVQVPAAASEMGRDHDYGAQSGNAEVPVSPAVLGPQFRQEHDGSRPVQASSAYAYPQEPVRSTAASGTAAGPEVYPGTDPYFEQEGRGDHAFYEEPLEEPRAKPRRAGLYMFAALAVLAAGGVGAMAWLKRDTVKVASGAAPLIKAETAPAKIPAQNPGGMEVPAQNTQIYNRAAPDDTKTAKVVPSEEQPVDVATAQRLAGNAPAGQTPPPAAAANRPAASIGMGEPKKVRSVTVRPDGTIVEEPARPAGQTGGQEPVRVLPGNAAGAGSPMPQTAPQSRPQTAMTVPPAASASAPSASPAPAPAAAGPAATALPPPRPSAPPPAEPARPTVAAAPPVAVQPPAPAPSPAPAPAPAQADAGTGDYAVQLAAPGSEAEARDAISRFQQRFGGVLGGYPLSARRAEVNNREIYRVRVGGLSREEANGLCERLKAAGGQCFVARN